MRGGAVSVAAQALRFVLTIVSASILSRLLTPDDFGLMAMATSATGFMAIFKDAGLSAAAVQSPKITHDQISTLFWIGLLISGSLAAISVAMAPVVRWFYHQPELTAVTAATGAGFLLAGLSVQHQALLRRKMRFTAIAALELGSQALAVIAAVVAALGHMGYWALVIRALALPASFALGIWLVCPWRPGHPVRGSGAMRMVKFGSVLTAFNLVNYFSRNLDNILIGWYWGKAPLGYYSRAFSLFMLPLTQLNYPISAVMSSALSRLQTDPQRFRRYFLEALRLVFFFGALLCSLLVAHAQEIIYVLLGRGWSESAVILQRMGPALVLQPVYSSMGWLFIPLGRTRELFRWGLVIAIWQSLSFAIGLRWGPQGVASCYSIAVLIMVPPAVKYGTRGSPVSFADAVAATWKPCLAACGATAAGLVARHQMVPLMGPHGRLFAAAAVTTLTFMVLDFGVLRDQRGYLKMVRMWRGSRPR